MANKLQFEVISNSDPEFLVLNNTSIYEAPAVSPTWKLKLPCDTAYKTVPISPIPVQNINAILLDIVCVDCETNPLPDGIYEIVYQEGAGPVFSTVTKYHLRTNQFMKQYQELLLKIEHSEFTVREDQVIKNICMDLDILIQSAQAHAEQDNIDRAQELFTKASKIIGRITKQLIAC
jgi:hypothetical protein